MKGIRIGKRRARGAELPSSPLELALRPAIVEGRWQIPDRFNFTRDVVEALARDPKRRALTFLGKDGVIEPRSFLEISEGANLWASNLQERGIGQGDRVLVVSGSTVDWLEVVLGALKAGAVVVPCAPTVTASMLERQVSLTDAALVVAVDSLAQTIERMGFSPDVHLFEEGLRRNSKDVPENVPTADTASRDLAFIASTGGVGGTRKDVAHTHGSVFATRVQAEHWLDVGRGDAVWCTSEPAAALTMWNTVVGPWSRGAEVVLQQGQFDADERLDLLFRLGPSILCQSPAEYLALAEHPKLERFRSPRLRRLVSTGDFLDPEIVATFEERWGMTIYDGYGQAETNIVIANQADGVTKPGSFGRALPGHHVGIIDDQGNELPIGIEGDLAIRGRPPTLFAGYWELPEETKAAFLGDWYVTGDVAHVDDEGFFTFVGRAEDVISSSGRTFGPFDVERALTGHQAIATAAVVGIRDLQRGGHFIRAFVVPRAGAEGSEQLEAELRQFVAQTLPDQQVPREIVFVDSLPTTGWKVSRHSLRERPLAGRPLWEMPGPELELEAEPVPASPAPEPALADPIPMPTPPPEAHAEPVVEAPVQRAVEPVVEVPIEPVLEAPIEPVLEAAPEPTPVELEPVAEVVPLLEPEPEPEPVTEATAFVPPTAPEPIEAVVEALIEPAPSPVEPELAAEPPVEPEAAVPEPEPELAAAEALPATEPEPAVFEPVPVEPEPEPVELAALPEPEAEPVPAEPELIPEPAAPERSERAPEPEPRAELTVIEPADLPDYVVEAPATPPPVVVPEPEPEPELGPLPDFVVDAAPQAAGAQAPAVGEPSAPIVQEPEEEEEDLGPLPDYVIDPTRPRPFTPPAPPRAVVKPVPPVELAPEPPVDESSSASAAGLYFPPTTAFPIPRPDSDDDEAPREPRRAPRRRASAEPAKPRSTEPAEPGDEGTEVSWMAGLSNRLSAYSLADEGAAEPAESDADADDGAADESSTAD